MARKPKPIDSERIKKLASIGCTVAEMAFVEGVSKDTLERRLMTAIEEGRAQGRASLRKLQWTAAQGGNVTMQIWLGKQLLGQRDFKLEAISDELLAMEVERRMRERSGK